MSGLEIVGVVLGAFPLILEGAKGLRSHLEMSKSWWNFRTEYSTFVSIIEGEAIAYSQNLEFLLSPLDLDQDQLRGLQEDPKSPQWHDSGVQKKLRDRIKNQYFNWFMRQLFDMNESLDELYGLLPIIDGKVTPLDTGTVDYEVLRLKSSFSRKKQPLLDRLVTINDSLYKFLVKDSQIQRNTRHRQSKSLLKLQSQAFTLYKAFKNNWNCSCINSHWFGIMAESKTTRLDTKVPTIKLLLRRDQELRQLKVELEQEELSFSSPKMPQSNKLDELAILNKQLRLNETSSTIVQAANSHSVALATVTAASTALSPTNTRTKKIWLKRQTKKLQKATQFLIGPSKPLSVTTTSIPQSTPKTSPPTRQVRFANDEAIVHPRQPELGRTIDDLCQFLNQPCYQESHEHINMGHQRVSFILDAQKGQDGRESSSIETLVAFLRSTKRLPDRLQVGLDLAMNILGLGASPWLPNRWDRDDVVLVKSIHPYTSSLGPFIVHKRLVETVVLSFRHTKAAETALFSLGVILLELTYQQTLEEQPQWAKFCVDGAPNSWTAKCTAMAWQEQVENHYSDLLSDPIRRCITGGFYSNADLSEPDFLQEVYDGVITPLEEFLSAWKTTPQA